MKTRVSPNVKRALALCALCAVAAAALLAVWGITVPALRGQDATTPAAPDTAPTAAALPPSDLALSLQFLPDAAEITAYEPLLAKVTLQNTTRDNVKYLERETPVVLEIFAADGQCVASTLDRAVRDARGPGGFSGIQRIAPGESYTQTWAISGLYTFDTPGRYDVQLTLYAMPYGKPPQKLAQAGAAMTVTPFDRAKLEQRCEALFAPIRDYEEKEISKEACYTALYSVRHDVMLPYLDWIATRSGTRDACLALRRIGSPRALALLEMLQARTDTVGDNARKAMNRPLATSMSDIVAN